MAAAVQKENGDENEATPLKNATDMTACLNKILDFSESQFTCSICSDLMDNPVAIACGHTFCCGCIENWFRTKQNCPCCREACPGGEHSDGIEPIKKYLRHLKPLLISRDKEQYCTIRRTLSAIITPTASTESIHNEATGICDEDLEIKRQRSFVLEEYMRERLLQVKTDLEFRSLEAALILVKCTLAKKNLSREEFQEDIEQFAKKPEGFVNKYMNHPTMTDIDHQYAPKIRKNCITFEWPTNRSWLQIIVLLIVGLFCYFALEELERDGFGILSEPLLRAISLLNVFIDLFGYFDN